MSIVGAAEVDTLKGALTQAQKEAKANVATRPEWIEVSVLKCHPWIDMLTHTVLEDL